MIKPIQHYWSCLPDTDEAVLLGRNANSHRHPILSRVLVSGKEIDSTSKAALLSRRKGCVTRASVVNYQDSSEQ
jgi:hypothetical protein